MISFYAMAIMLCLFAADVIYTHIFKATGFLRMSKKSGVLYAIPRIFILILLPYWAGTYLLGKNSLVIQLLICFALSAGLMGLEYFLQDKKDEFLTCRYLPAMFCLSVITLFFIHGYDFELTVKNHLIYSLSGFALSLFSVLTYSAIKSKVSTFRNGTVLATTAAGLSALVFGIVAGVIIKSCLG